MHYGVLLSRGEGCSSVQASCPRSFSPALGAERVIPITAAAAPGSAAAEAPFHGNVRFACAAFNSRLPLPARSELIFTWFLENCLKFLNKNNAF